MTREEAMQVLADGITNGYGDEAKEKQAVIVLAAGLLNDLSSIVDRLDRIAMNGDLLNERLLGIEMNLRR